MRAHRVAADRVTYTASEQIIDLTIRLSVDYYRQALQHMPSAEKTAFFRRAVMHGLNARDLYSAIDYAVSLCGYGQIERDYWPHIQMEARRIWREMYGKAERNPP